MKVLFDMSTFSAIHCGGKDEVAYNLLRGFSKLDKVDEFVCVANPEIVPIIKGIDKRYKVIGIKSNTAGMGLHLNHARILQKIIDRCEIDVVVYTNKIAPCRKLSVPTILIPHDVQFVKRAKEGFHISAIVYSLFILLNFKICDYIIAISDFDKNEMIKYIPSSKNKVTRIYDPIRFKDITLSDKREYITAINIQWPHKNVITLLKAYALLKDSISEKLVLVGRQNFSNKLKEQINQIIANNNLGDRVIFTGYVDDEKLSEIISKTRVYVNPSLFEGFGMTAVEMMGCRIPTIVADNSAQMESTMGKCRYYSPSDSEIELKATIYDEISNPTSKRRLIDIAEIIRREYNYLNISRQYYELFSNICGDRDFKRS